MTSPTLTGRSAPARPTNASSSPATPSALASASSTVSASSASCGLSTTRHDGEGRHYVIERELTTMAELEAIVADYLEQAAAWNAIPAAGACCLVPELREQGR